jgi:hypothetical protein
MIMITTIYKSLLSYKDDKKSVINLKGSTGRILLPTARQVKGMCGPAIQSHPLS